MAVSFQVLYNLQFIVLCLANMPCKYVEIMEINLHFPRHEIEVSGHFYFPFPSPPPPLHTIERPSNARWMETGRGEVGARAVVDMVKRTFLVSVLGTAPGHRVCSPSRYVARH